MVAALRFIKNVHDLANLTEVGRLQISLHGSLAFTGKGHGSDYAIILGLLGKSPENFDPNSTNKIIKKTQKYKNINISKT
jgi:L-serine dehydratase